MFDKVQCGFGLTGKFWASEYYVNPDIIAFGKMPCEVRPLSPQLIVAVKSPAWLPGLASVNVALLSTLEPGAPSVPAAAAAPLPVRAASATSTVPLANAVEAWSVTDTLNPSPAPPRGTCGCPARYEFHCRWPRTDLGTRCRWTGRACRRPK